MNRISSVLIAGSGAIGSMIASQIFLKSPSRISVLAGGERRDRYLKDGFVINGTLCHFPITAVESSSDPDLVIIACKAHHLEQVLRDLKNHIGKNTRILSLLNGISSEHCIGAVYTEQKIPYAMILGTDAGHEGNRTTFSKTGIIFFGDAKNEAELKNCSDHVQAIASFFEEMKISYTVPENMINRLWFKFMMNVALNQVTAILQKPYRILKKNSFLPEAGELLDSAMQEVISIAQAEGITLTTEDKRTVYQTIDTLGDEGKTSMCQDVEAQRKTEVELFAGTMIELGKKHGISVPVNTVFFRMLKTIENSYEPLSKVRLHPVFSDE